MVCVKMIMVVRMMICIMSLWRCIICGTCLCGLYGDGGDAETMMSMVQTEIAHNLSVFKGWLGNLRSRFGSGECEAAGRRLDKDILGKETQSTSSPTAALW